MGEAVQLIEMNLTKIKDVKDQCKIYDADIQRFKDELKFKGFERKIYQLDYPKTVCAGDKCKKYISVGKSRERNNLSNSLSWSLLSPRNSNWDYQ